MPINVKVTDRLIVYILCGILAVLSTVTIVGNRDARDAAVRAEVAAQNAREAAVGTDVLAACFQPGTPCATELERRDRQERLVIRQEMRHAALCTLLTSRAIPTGTPVTPELLEQEFIKCVDARSIIQGQVSGE